MSRRHPRTVVIALAVALVGAGAVSPALAGHESPRPASGTPSPGAVSVPVPAAPPGHTQEPDAQARAREAFERGEAALERGDLPAAIAAFRQALEHLPGNPGLELRLGQSLFLAGDPEAVEHLEAAREGFGDRPEVAFLLAQAYLASGRFEEAAAALDIVEASNPDIPDVQLARGELCYLVGRLDGAESHLQRAVELAARPWGPALYRLGLVEVARRHWEAAVDWLERAVAASPDDPEAWLLLATARTRAGDPAGSLAAVERAVEVAPDFVLARTILAERYDGADRVPELMQQVEAILDLDPDNPIALMHRANRAALDGRFEEALADLQRLLGDPDTGAGLEPGARNPALAALTEPVARGALRSEAARLEADLLARTGRVEEAITAARRLVQEDPDFPDAHFLLGNLLLRQQDPEGREHLERFKQLSDARRMRRLGENFLETSDDPALAEKELQAALEAWPEDRAAKVALARVRRLQGQPAVALELLNEARGDPGTAEQWYREVILSLAAAGRPTEARQAWERARELGMVLDAQVWAVVYEGEYGCS